VPHQNYAVFKNTARLETIFLNTSLLIGSNGEIMDNLGKNWFVEPAIDFELKKYILLDWLQKAGAEVDNMRLYPFAGVLKEHISVLERYLENKSGFEEHLHKEIAGIDPESGQLLFHPREDYQLNEIAEVDMIVRYSLKKLRDWSIHMNHLVEELSRSIRIAPVGIEPLYKKEGYIFIPVEKKIIVFEYSSQQFFRSENEDTYSIITHYLHDYDWTLSSTLEGLKQNIHKTYHKFDAPAVFICESKVSLPLYETFLPLAEKKLLHTIYHE
jgi:hypothetical protein